MKRYLHADNGFVDREQWEPDSWINIEQPDAADIEFLTSRLGVPEGFIESLADIDERPRVDSEDGWLMTILRVLMPDPEGDMPYTTVPLGILTNDDSIVTVCYHKTEVVDSFIEFTRRRSLLITKRQDFIMRMLWVATWWFLKYLREIDSRVNSAEKELRKSVRNRDLMILMRLQKTLVFFNTSIHGNEALIEHLRRSYADDCDADLLEDLEIEMKQADNTVGVYSDILSGTMDAYASIISNNVNEIMKRMTSITIILMIPTLIASFYGMNVDGLWLASVRGSFFIVVGIAVVLTVATYIVLRKIKWF